MQDEDRDVDAGEKKLDDEKRQPAVDVDAGDDSTTADDYLGTESLPSTDYDVDDVKDEISSSDEGFVFVEKDVNVDHHDSKYTESVISALAGKAASKYKKLVKDYPVMAEMLTQLGDELGFPGSPYVELADLFTKLYELSRKPEKEAWDEIYATVKTVGAAWLGFIIVCLIKRNFTFTGLLGYLFKRGLKISPLMAGPKEKPEDIRKEVERLVKRAVAERAGTTAFAGGLTDQQILQLFERYRVLKKKRDKRAGAAPVSSDDGDTVGGGDVESQSGGSTSKSSKPKPLGQVFWLDSHEDLGTSLLPGFTFSTTHEFWRLFLDRELSRSKIDSQTNEDGNRHAELSEIAAVSGDEGKLTRVAAFPIGIDSDPFIQAPELPQVVEHMRDLKERFAGRKVILGVDRHDITGIPQKLLAFEQFLEENPDWRDKVVLLQIAVQARTDLPECMIPVDTYVPKSRIKFINDEKLTCQVHEIVGRINGRFGTITAVPIHYLERSHDFSELCELYAVTDVALFTSLRDGTNLASYEFVACQASKKGVLILSKFAGAAQFLGAGAILVDPWDITEVAASIGDALNMPDGERKKRHQDNFMHVTTHTSQEWAATFVSELNDTIVKAQLRTGQVPPLIASKGLVDRYFQSDNRLLILGFNTTLTEPKSTRGRRRGQIREMELKLHLDLKEPLKRLCNESKTTVVVLNGGVIDHNFGDYNMWLTEENGMFLRLTTGEWMTAMPENLNMDRVDIVKLIFEYLTERTPLAHFKCHETSLKWNYKDADVEFRRLSVKDLPQHLWTDPLSNASVNVAQGGQSGVTKGAATQHNLGIIVHNKGMKAPIDYALCIGNFLPKEPAEGGEREAIPPDSEEGGEQR